MSDESSITASKPFCISAAVSVWPRFVAIAIIFVPARSLFDLAYWQTWFASMSWAIRFMSMTCGMSSWAIRPASKLFCAVWTS